MEYAEDLQMDSQESAKRMEEGRLYLPSDPEIMKKQFDCLEKLYDYNQTRPHDQELRARMLKDMFAELGEGCYIDLRFVPTGVDIIPILEIMSTPTSI